VALAVRDALGSFAFRPPTLLLAAPALPDLTETAAASEKAAVWISRRWQATWWLGSTSRSSGSFLP
jgi:hypothetical protein